MDSVVNPVVKIIQKDFEDETLWEQKVSRIASYMKDLINDTFSLVGVGGIIDKGKTTRPGPDGKTKIEIPEDLLELMDNPLENKNQDKLREDIGDELKQKAEEFAKDTPYSQFGAPAGQAGLVQIYPEVWSIGDPIEELAVVQTVLSSPIIIPNVTTRKWAYKEGPGHLV